MSTPIFEALKAAHGFDPLENVECEQIMAWDETEPVAEIAIWRAPEFPKFKAGADAYGYWAVLRGEWVGDHFFVYQPCARLETEEDAELYAAHLNRMNE